MWGVNAEFDLIALSLQPEPLLVLLAALLIDAVTGNVPYIRRFVPHPVSLLAGLVHWLEIRLNRERRSTYARLIRGVLVVVFVLGVSFGLGWAVALIAAMVPFGWLLALFVIGSLVAQRGPFDEVRGVVRGLRVNDLAAAGDAAAQFLGPGAANRDEAALVRDSANHLAVQLLDGLVAAVFWFVLLGLPGLFAWRAINVMNRLLDASEPRMAYFGWIPTRLNDAVAYLPSLLAGLLIVAGAAFVPTASPWRALRVMLRDGSRHRSLSLGSPVAAMAGALGIALSGPRQLLPGAPGRHSEAGQGSDTWVGQADARTLITRADAVRALYLYAVACLLAFFSIVVLAMARFAIG